MHVPRTLAVVVAMLLSACASGLGGTPSPSGTPLTLEGSSWVVTQIEGVPTVATTKPTIAFVNGTVHGNASCNSYSSGFSQSGSTLTVTPGAMTAMACADDQLTAQESAFMGALSEVRQVRGTASGAELLDSLGEPVLTLAPAPTAPPKPLVGTNWTLSGIVSGDTVSSPIEGTTVTITLTDETLTGKACNTFRGSVTKTDSTLKVGPLMSTKMACPTEQEGKQETTVLAVLGTVTRYAIEGDTLTLSAPDGKGLMFTA